MRARPADLLEALAQGRIDKAERMATAAIASQNSKQGFCAAGELDAIGRRGAFTVRALGQSSVCCDTETSRRFGPRPGNRAGGNDA